MSLTRPIPTHRPLYWCAWRLLCIAFYWWATRTQEQYLRDCAPDNLLEGQALLIQEREAQRLRAAFTYWRDA